MTNKKLIASLLAVSMLPAAASAVTIEELQAQINALLAAKAGTTTTTCSYVFTKTLKQGMSDAEVMNLQKVLNTDPSTQVAAMGVGSAGNETMYFGPATKAAVVKYQNKYAATILAPQGLTMGTGQVGASTRASLNKMCSTPTTPTTPTIPATTVTPGELKGGAGTFTATKYSSDVEDNVVTGSAETVLSFKGKAEGSDVKVTNVKLALEKITTGTGSTGSTYLNRYFKSFDIYSGDTKVGTADVDNFTRDSAGKYSMTVTINNAVVRMGTANQVIFKIKANAVDTIDTDNVNGGWKMTYSDFRYVDATGVILTSSSSDTDTYFYVEKLASSSDVKIKVSSGTSNPDERIVFVSDDASGDKVTMNEFKVKAEGTKITFDVVKATYAVTGTTTVLKNKTTEIQLVRGDTVIDSIDPEATEGAGTSYENDTTNKVLTFNLDTSEIVNQDESVTYKIVAKMQKINTSTFALGDTVSISVPSTDSSTKSVNAEDKNGDSISYTKFSGSSSGKAQTFRATGIDVMKVTSAATAIPKADTAVGYGKFTMDLKVTASGDDLWIPYTASSSASASTTIGVSYQIENSAGSVLSTGTTSAVVSRVSGGTDDNGYVKIADGENSTLRITVSYDPVASGFARMQVTRVNYALTKVTPTTSIVLTPESTFETDSVDIRP